MKTNKSSNDVVQADFAFHYEIICMSHNKLYMDIYMMVQQLISSHIRHLIYTVSIAVKRPGFHWEVWIQ